VKCKGSGNNLILIAHDGELRVGKFDQRVHFAGFAGYTSESFHRSISYKARWDFYARNAVKYIDEGTVRETNALNAQSG